jgi:hypothetical protein
VVSIAKVLAVLAGILLVIALVLSTSGSSATFWQHRLNGTTTAISESCVSVWDRWTHPSVSGPGRAACDVAINSRELQALTFLVLGSLFGGAAVFSWRRFRPADSS